MDSNHNTLKIPTVSPISTTLKRKRGPSLSGDLPGKPALKQNKEEVVEAALEEIDELEAYDSSGDESNSSGSSGIIVFCASPIFTSDRLTQR